MIQLTYQPPPTYLVLTFSRKKLPLNHLTLLTLHLDGVCQRMRLKLNLAMAFGDTVEKELTLIIQRHKYLALQAAHQEKQQAEVPLHSKQQMILTLYQYSELILILNQEKVVAALTIAFS